MAKAAERRYEVYITGTQTHKGPELRIEIAEETAPLTQQPALFKYESKWEEARDTVKQHIVLRVPIGFHVWYRVACWDLLPPRHEFTKFSAIDVLSLDHYPHLEHIDVTALPFLRKFSWHPIKDATASIQKRKYTLTSVRITGLTQCKYLEELLLQGMLHHPFILKLKAPFRNLQALEELAVEFKCVNQHYPLELVASQSLRSFMYNGRWMLGYFRALRSILVCACIVVHRYPPQRHQGHGRDIPALAKAIAYGPIHDPSLIIDVAWVIRRRMDQHSTPIAHAL